MSFKARCCLPRRTWSSTGWSRSKYARAKNQSAAPLRGCPPTASRTSPGRRPALSIGPTGSTLLALNAPASTHPSLAGPQNSPRIEQERECIYGRYHVHPPGRAPRQHEPLALRLAVRILPFLLTAIARNGGCAPRARQSTASADEWSATLNLPDYGRVARDSPTTRKTCNNALQKMVSG